MTIPYEWQVLFNNCDVEVKERMNNPVDAQIVKELRTHSIGIATRSLLVDMTIGDDQVFPTVAIEIGKLTPEANHRKASVPQVHCPSRVVKKTVAQIAFSAGTNASDSATGGDAGKLGFCQMGGMDQAPALIDLLGL